MNWDCIIGAVLCLIGLGLFVLIFAVVPSMLSSWINQREEQRRGRYDE